MQKLERCLMEPTSTREQLVHNFIPVSLWTFKFRKSHIHNTEREGGNSTHFFFFKLALSTRLLWDTYVHFINDDLPLDAAHKQQHTWNSKDWQAAHRFLVSDLLANLLWPI